MVDERIDTVWNRDPSDLGNEFDDQSDDLPQRIFPRYYTSGAAFSPHPLLRSPIGDINVLPDHPHESVCLPGDNLADLYTKHGLNLTEFPVEDGVPLTPEVIATSISAGQDIGKPPTTPRCFGAISVWDGHRVGKGRIVCDATWHHFIDINLDGTGSISGTGTRNGLRRGSPLTFTNDYYKVVQYYRNIADWLVPTRRRWCRWWIDIVIERFSEPLFEEWRPLPPHPCPWEPRVELGKRVEYAMDQSRGRGFATELTSETLALTGYRQLAELMRPRPGRDANLLRRTRVGINVDELRHGILGSIFDAVARELPELPQQMRQIDSDKLEDTALKRAAESISQAKDAFLEYQNEAIANTRRWLRKIE
jgi:hypothetical protein